MPRRDPETGQYVAGQSFDDIEQYTFSAQIGIEAANMTGGTGFTGGDNHVVEGIELLDFDDIIDRDEGAQLLTAYHSVSVFQNSTTTEDGTVLGEVEVSATPSRSVIGGVGTPPLEGDWVGGVDVSDSIDVIGRPLLGVATGPFSDTVNGIGGGGATGEDSYEIDDIPTQVGAFHPRDELFMNASLAAWNIADAGVHILVEGQHTYGIES